MSSPCPQIRTSRPTVSTRQSERAIAYLGDIRRPPTWLLRKVQGEDSRKDWRTSARPRRALSGAGLTLSVQRCSIKHASAILTEGANLEGQCRPLLAPSTRWACKISTLFLPISRSRFFRFRGNNLSPFGGDTVIQQYNEQPYSISDAVTWNVKSHTISFGMDVRWWHTYQNNPSPPELTFDGSGSGDPFADYLDGLCGSGNRTRANCLRTNHCDVQCGGIQFPLLRSMDSGRLESLSEAHHQRRSSL